MPLNQSVWNVIRFLCCSHDMSPETLRPFQRKGALVTCKFFLPGDVLVFGELFFFTLRMFKNQHGSCNGGVNEPFFRRGVFESSKFKVATFRFKGPRVRILRAGEKWWLFWNRPNRKVSQHFKWGSVFYFTGGGVLWMPNLWVFKELGWLKVVWFIWGNFERPQTRSPLTRCFSVREFSPRRP